MKLTSFQMHLLKLLMQFTNPTYNVYAFILMAIKPHWLFTTLTAAIS